MTSGAVAGGAIVHPEDPARCTCASRPTSRGTSPPTSSPSRSSASRPSTARSASSTGGPAVSSRPSPSSARSARSATRPRWPPPASFRSGGSSPSPPATPTRSTARPSTASGRRSSGGSAVGTSSRLAVWVGDLPDRLDGGAAAVVELLVRGVVEGQYEPKGIYLDKVEDAPPTLDELILVVPGGDAAAPGGRRRARPDHRRGREHRPDPGEPGVERRQPGGPRRRGERDRQAQRPVDRRHLARAGGRARDGHVPGRRAGGATTRPG